MYRLLQATCLKPAYSLRWQLLLSYGSTAAITLTVMVTIACTMTWYSSVLIEGRCMKILRGQVIDNLQQSSRFAAESFSGKLADLEATVQLMVELVQERIVGYPLEGWYNNPQEPKVGYPQKGWQDDVYVPFVDWETGQNRYPLKSPLIPLDWNITKNINASNAEEHLQERAKYLRTAYRSPLMVSSASASFFVQGACDPLAEGPDSPAFYENCAPANNDVRRGGVVRPTPEARSLHEKASDLGALLKPLFEAQPHALHLTVSFHNMGAGATLQYPGTTRNGTARPYTSAGCEWLTRNVNPYTNKPFGTREDAARCHPANASVPHREQNPVEQSWYRDCALNPYSVQVMGPFYPEHGIPTLLVARGIFDQMTGHFIGCASIDVPLADIVQELHESSLHDTSHAAIVQVNSDEVVAHTMDGFLERTEEADDKMRQGSTDFGTLEAPNVADLGIIESERYQQMKEELSYLIRGELWTPEQFEASLSKNIGLCLKAIKTVYPIPVPPEQYDPSYRPKMLLVHSLANDVFEVIDEMNTNIREDLMRVVIRAAVVSVCGLILILIIVTCVARVLTRPLLWIERAAWRIVNHTDKRAGEALGNDGSGESEAMVRCIPRTEITRLVSEFRAMIESFSGDGASRIAEPHLYEIPNEMTWQSDFQQVLLDNDAAKTNHEHGPFASQSTVTAPMSAGSFTTSSGVEDKTGPDIQEQPIMRSSSLRSHEQQGAPQNVGEVPEEDTEVTIMLSSSRRGSRELSGKFKLEDMPGPITLSASRLSIREPSAEFNAERGTCTLARSSSHRGSRQFGLSKEGDASMISSSRSLGNYISTDFQESKAVGQTSSPPRRQSRILGQDIGGKILPGEGNIPTSRLGSNELLSALSEDNTATSIMRSASRGCSKEVNTGSREEDLAAIMSSPIILAPRKLNAGRNILPGDTSVKKIGLKARLGKHPRARTSPLFWWLVALMVIPLLLTNLAIWHFVTSNILDAIPSWIELARSQSAELSIQALKSTTKLKAKFAQTIINEPVKAVHTMARVAGWLAFDGITRSSSFNKVETATGLCKKYPSIYSRPSPEDICPFYESDRHVCLCEWEDPAPPDGGACTTSNKSYTRPLQRRFFSAMAIDANPTTGARREAKSFPRLYDSPNNTRWWSNPKAMPGSYKVANSSGYTTTYDRLRMAAAMDIIEIPIYNYVTHLGRPKVTAATMVAFDADGLTVGYGQCQNFFIIGAHFQSNDGNGAYRVAPKLCPKGMFGYDPRCRSWYSQGKSKYLSDQRPLHITPIYSYGSGHYGTTATSPIANPATKEYVGQMMFDFFPTGVRDSLHRVKQPVSVLITPEKDAVGGDTVVGLNKTAAWKSSSVLDLLFQNSDPLNRALFESDILSAMKNGSSDKAEFQRIKADGISTETLTIAYEPVHVRALSPLHAGDFSRGLNVSKLLVYSVGIAAVSDDSAYSDMYDEVVDIERLGHDTMGLALIVTFLFAVVICKITVVVTRPVVTLLMVLQRINSREFEDNLPPLQGGSREVNKVYSSFAKLHKIVRISNSAFFSGNLKWAYHFVSDALQLFRKVNDQKAIGVACNNLGNAIFAMRSESRGASSDEEVFDASEALEYYNEAIRIAQIEFDQATHEELKADFAQQFADRLFNRGLFLLLIRDDGPEDAEERAYRDIDMARQLDYDVRDFLIERRLLLKYSGSCFARLMRRIHGLLDHFDDDRLREVWNPRELVEDADSILFAAWNEENAPLFEAITRIGRLQQLEAAAIRLELLLNNKFEACRLAMRGFTEDEYMLDCLFKSSANALTKLMKEERESVPWSSKTISTTRTDLRRMTSTCKNFRLDFGKCFITSLDIGARWEADPIRTKINKNCLKLYDVDVAPTDYAAVVAFTSKGDLTVGLGRKGENSVRQRSMLDLATTASEPGDTQCPVEIQGRFPYAVQMIVDSSVSTEMDSFLLHITDGSSWDFQLFDSLRSRIEVLNRERNTMIHVIIIGLGLKDDAILAQCIQMCNVSKISFFAEATYANIDTVFDAVGAAIASSTDASNCVQGITMEKF